jgi:hypothetical protein
VREYRTQGSARGRSGNWPFYLNSLKQKKMSAIYEIERELMNFPQIQYVKEKSSIVIAPEEESGFEIVFYENENDYIVHFKGWHEHFINIDEATNCIKFGLSNKCRLKEFSRGEKPYKWVVEYLENDNWLVDSETGLLNIYFWKKKQIQTYQNNIILNR